MFTKIMQEYRAGTGAYDALNVIPAWMPDLAQAGALEQLDSYVDKYGFRAELQKIAPTYRDNQMTVNGKKYDRWHMPDGEQVHERLIAAEPNSFTSIGSTHESEIE